MRRESCGQSALQILLHSQRDNADLEAMDKNTNVNMSLVCLDVTSKEWNVLDDVLTLSVAITLPFMTLLAWTRG